MTAWYNENNADLADWLENLIAAGEIAPGVVDRRSIEDVVPNDIRDFTQCHFFAGIGIWSYALRQAGWPDDRAVWTGSCPCQPFSAAGKGTGFTDERHLWPAWQHLIRVLRPGVILGEQVASPDGLAWLDLVQTDMEVQDYTFGPLDLCSAGFGAPHGRQRLHFVADSNDSQRRAAQSGRNDRAGEAPRWSEGHGNIETRCTPGPANGFWRTAEWLQYSTGEYRGLEPGTSPLAYVDPATMVKLSAYGNAINAEPAIEFIRAYLEEEQDNAL